MQRSSNIADAGEVPAPVQWAADGTLRLVDQTLLPGRLEYFYCRSVEDLAHAVRTLRVRGAPSIGVAAAYGLSLAANLSHALEAEPLLADLESAAALLRATRPTAVNLAWALHIVLASARGAAPLGAAAVRSATHEAALRIDRENDAATRRMGEHGSALIKSGMNILTHCNTGPLAAGGIGSALGVLYTAYRQGRQVHVWVDETRPLLQGARLTTWELGVWGIPHTLITDSMAASLMSAGKVDAVIVGADRIAANGDVANKIGTYGLAVLARAHDIPFYIAAPSSTFDPDTPSGLHIRIEERAPEEVAGWGGVRTAPEGVRVHNPAFDITPARLITAIVTEQGVLSPPFEERITALGQSPSRPQPEAISTRGGA